MVMSLFKPKESKAAEQARQGEARAQLRLQEQQNQINSIFDAPERKAQYADFLQALRQQYRMAADQGFGEAGRNRRFAMARRGLVGGSYDVDTARNLRDEYDASLLSGERTALSQMFGLQGADNAQRLSLMGMAQGQGDAMGGARLAADAMRTNLATQRSLFPATAFSQIGQAVAKAYGAGREARANQSGQKSAFQG